MTTFDSGSYRNAMKADFLRELENNPELVGRSVLTKRAACAPTEILGVTLAPGQATAGYKEVVGAQVTFKSVEGHTATTKLLFVVLEHMTSDLILGCPTLDTIGYGSTKEFITLDAYDLLLPLSCQSRKHLLVLR